MSYRPPILGFDPEAVDACDYRPPIIGFDPDDIDGRLQIAWADRTVIATIPGGVLSCLHECEAQQEAEQVEEARREEIRNLAENVILLDDRRK